MRTHTWYCRTCGTDTAGTTYDQPAATVAGLEHAVTEHPGEAADIEIRAGL